ncbi:MAG: hypothetical protein WKI04_18495 [Ferruginibacter sp.]
MKQQTDLHQTAIELSHPRRLSEDSNHDQYQFAFLIRLPAYLQ